MWTLPPRFKCG
ncbi:MAG: hypothetical protein F2898_03025 [Actinobacteria bacterium]|nr:hypothetical protein [Actinomycetota bacterium]MSY97073.1 hypothetical protein [Actinomycetota bacterium]